MIVPSHCFRCIFSYLALLCDNTAERLDVCVFRFSFLPSFHRAFSEFFCFLNGSILGRMFILFFKR